MLCERKASNNIKLHSLYIFLQEVISFQIFLFYKILEIWCLVYNFRCFFRSRYGRRLNDFGIQRLVDRLPRWLPTVPSTRTHHMDMVYRRWMTPSPTTQTQLAQKFQWKLSAKIAKASLKLSFLFSSPPDPAFRDTELGSRTKELSA